MIAGETYTVYPGVVLGKDVRIGPFAVLGLPGDGWEGVPPRTVIGDGARIGAHAVIEAGAQIGKGFRCGHGTVIGGDVVIGDGCTVGAGCHLDHVRLGEGVEVQDLVVMGILPQDKYDYHQVGADWEPVVEVGPGSIIRSHSSIYAKVRIGPRFNGGHGVRIREGTVIGEGTTVGTNSQVDGFVTIGKGVLIHTNVHICQFAVLEDESYVTAGSVLTNTPHPRCPLAKPCMKGPVIRRGAKVAANVVVGPYVEIGEDALVGAGAAAMKDIPAGQVAVGVPAKPIKSVYELTCPFGWVEHPYTPREEQPEG